MQRKLRGSALFAVVSLLAVSSFGQNGSVWRTSNDVREGSRGSLVGTVADVNDAANRLMITPDDAASAQVTVTVDSLGTQFFGFGGMINGQPEIFNGSKGFSNLRTGDRLEVRGTGRGVGNLIADSITLLGRSVPAGTTGVGDTRPLGSISTPSATGRTSTTVGNYGRMEGVVRTVNGDDNRIVIETDRREMITIRGGAATDVRYRNTTYRIRDLEEGDRIRVDVDTSGGTTGDIRARSIEVIESVQDRSGSSRSGPSGPSVTVISGRVTRIDRATESVWIDNGRGEVRADIHSANDQSGRRVRAVDLHVNDRVDVTGSYGNNSDVFMASTLRWVDEVISGSPSTPGSPRPNGGTSGAEPSYVTFSGTITESLRNGPQLTIRDTKNNRSIRVFVLEDFAVRSKAGGYVTADRLNESDSVIVKAFRDTDGNYIAQTIRVR